MARYAPGHWGFLGANLHLTNSQGWGREGYRHRRHYLECCKNPLGESNCNLLHPDRTDLEGVPFILSNSSMMSSDTSETEGGPLEALGSRSLERLEAGTLVAALGFWTFES